MWSVDHCFGCPLDFFIAISASPYAPHYLFRFLPSTSISFTPRPPTLPTHAPTLLLLWRPSSLSLGDVLCPSFAGFYCPRSPTFFALARQPSSPWGTSSAADNYCRHISACAWVAATTGAHVACVMPFGVMQSVAGARAVVWHPQCRSPDSGTAGQERWTANLQVSYHRPCKKAQ